MLAPQQACSPRFGSWPQAAAWAAGRPLPNRRQERCRECRQAECRQAECRQAECRQASAEILRADDQSKHRPLVMPSGRSYEFDMIDEELTPPPPESTLTAAKRRREGGAGAIFASALPLNIHLQSMSLRRATDLGVPGGRGKCQSRLKPTLVRQTRKASFETLAPLAPQDEAPHAEERTKCASRSIRGNLS